MPRVTRSLDNCIEVRGDDNILPFTPFAAVRGGQDHAGASLIIVLLKNRDDLRNSLIKLIDDLDGLGDVLRLTTLLCLGFVPPPTYEAT